MWSMIVHLISSSIKIHTVLNTNFYLDKQTNFFIYLFLLSLYEVGNVIKSFRMRILERRGIETKMCVEM